MITQQICGYFDEAEFWTFWIQNKCYNFLTAAFGAKNVRKDINLTTCNSYKKLFLFLGTTAPVLSANVSSTSHYLDENKWWAACSTNGPYAVISFVCVVDWNCTWSCRSIGIIVKYFDGRQDCDQVWHHEGLWTWN